MLHRHKQHSNGYKPVVFVFVLFSCVIIGLVFLLEPRKSHRSSVHDHTSLTTTTFPTFVDARNIDNYPSPPPPPPLLRSCPVGSKFYPELDECLRNIYWPDPVDSSLQDMTSAPCDDFYQYSCGAFIEDPQNVGQDATFKHLYNNNQKIVRDIITSVVLSDPSSKLSVFYNSCLRENVDIVTADSILVEKTLFAMIDNNIKSINDISFMMGVLQKYDTVLPLELSFELDPKNADILVPLLKQGGLFASSPLDIDTQEHFLSIFQRFQKYIRDKDARFMAKSVVDIEKSLAAIFSDTAARNIVEYIPVYESSDRIIDWRRFFSSFDSAFNLTAFFLGARPASIPSNLWMDSLYQSHLWCHTSLYIKQLSDVIRSHSIASWQNYFKHALLFHLVDDGAPHIDPGSHYAFHREYDSQHSLPWRRIRRFLSITDSPSTNRSSECIFQTQAYLPVILDNYFVHSELDSLSRASAKDVVEFIRTTFINIIPRLSLFRNKGFEVINYAIQKIRSTVIHIGTPDSWPIDRSDLILTPSSFYENIIRIRQYHMEQNYKLFVNHIQSRDPVTPDELFDGLLTVANGVFQHQLNAITLNAGLLRPPIFSRLYDNIAKFARLGYLVAHELAHAIDENGSHFSATGSIYSWYTLDSSVKSCLISMYSVTTPRGNSQDGKRTLQENFADTVGFIVAYEAFLSYQTTYGFPVTVDQQQEFYLAFSQLYCESLSQEEELRVLKSFSHSIGSVRVNSLVSQLSDFSSVWQCPLSFLPNPFSPCIYLTDDKK